MKSIYGKHILTVALVWLPCFVLFAIFYMLVIRQQSTKRADIEKRVVEARQLCDAAEAVTQEKTRAELNRQIEKIHDKVKNFLVDEKDYADLTFAISKMASEKNISEFSIRTEDKQQGSANAGFSHIYEKHMSVNFTSGFNQFAGFLNALERYQPVIFVNNFRMTRSEDKPTGHKISMNLVVLVRKGFE